MRQDLDDSQAVIDWAVAQIKILVAEIDSWLQTNPYTESMKFDPDRGMNAHEINIADPPRLIDVHAGIIIHALRSALDILAVALARRNGVTKVDQIYFPISGSLDIFNSKGVKKVKGLAPPDIDEIKKLQPYKGGNDTLFALHQMDVMRKHTRLIRVATLADLQGWSGWGETSGAFEYKVRRDAKNQTFTLWLTDPDPQINISMQIALIETDFLPSMPIGATLRDFARLTQSIVNTFA